MRILSKSFLLGEYAVLFGAPAIVLCFPPAFTLEKSSTGSCFHPESPAGKLLGNKSFNFVFADPYQGRGGFGGSTAEFALAYLATQSESDPWKAWQTYRNLAKGSGVDLIAQMLAKQPIAVYVNTRTQETKLLPLKLSLAVFRTGHKLKTHEHLDRLVLEDISSPWGEIVNTAVASWDDPLALGLLLDQYQDLLKSRNLLAEESANLLQNLRNIPGVIGAKACGALGADALVAVFSSDHFSQGLAACSNQGFELVWHT